MNFQKLTDEEKRTSFPAYFNEDELKDLRDAAKKDNRSVSGFIRHYCLKIADKINNGGK